MFEARDVIGEIIALERQVSAVLSHLAGEGFIAKQLFDALGEFLLIHPGDEKAVMTIDEPIANAACVEGDDWKAVAHDFEADGGDWFRPNGADRHEAGFAKIAFQIGLRNKPGEANTILQAEFFGQRFAFGFVAAVAQNEAFEWDLEQGERFEEDIDAFAANDLSDIKDEVAGTERTLNIWISHSGDRRDDLDFF